MLLVHRLLQAAWKGRLPTFLLGFCIGGERQLFALLVLGWWVWKLGWVANKCLPVQIDYALGKYTFSIMGNANFWLCKTRLGSEMIVFTLTARRSLKLILFVVTKRRIRIWLQFLPFLSLDFMLRASILRMVYHLMVVISSCWCLITQLSLPILLMVPLRWQLLKLFSGSLWIACPSARKTLHVDVVRMTAIVCLSGVQGQLSHFSLILNHAVPLRILIDILLTCRFFGLTQILVTI